MSFGSSFLCVRISGSAFHVLSVVLRILLWGLRGCLCGRCPYCFLFGLRSIKCMGNGWFEDRCLTFQMFVASCPFKACLMSFTSVEGWRFLRTTLKLLSCRGL